MFTEDLNVLKCHQRIFSADTIPGVWWATAAGDNIPHWELCANLQHVCCSLYVVVLRLLCIAKTSWPCAEETTNYLVLQVVIFHFIFWQNRNWMEKFLPAFVMLWLLRVKNWGNPKYHNAFLAWPPATFLTWGPELVTVTLWRLRFAVTSPGLRQWKAKSQPGLSVINIWTRTMRRKAREIQPDSWYWTYAMLYL